MILKSSISEPGLIFPMAVLLMQYTLCTRFLLEYIIAHPKLSEEIGSFLCVGISSFTAQKQSGKVV